MGRDDVGGCYYLQIEMDRLITRGGREGAVKMAGLREGGGGALKNERETEGWKDGGSKKSRKERGREEE